MPTVIDSLVVELGLDPTQFNKQQKDTLDQYRKTVEGMRSGGREIESQGRKLEDVFSSLKREVLGTAALFMGGKGIKEFINNITTLDAATGRAAYTMNMSARELSVWDGAGKLVGAQAGSITNAMKGLSAAMNDFSVTGKGSFGGVLNHLGLSMTDSNNLLKNPAQMFLEISEAVHKLSQTDPARAASVLRMIPGANEDSINLMIKGRKALEDLVAKYKAVGGATELSKQQADEYIEKTVLLNEAMTNLGRSLLTLVAPAITAVANSLSKLFSGWNHSADSIEGKGIIAAGSQSTKKLLGKPEAFLNAVGSKLFPMLGMKYTDKDRETVKGWYEGDEARNIAAIKAAQELKKRSPDTGGGPGRGTLAEQEAMIRKHFAAKGIDTNIATQVWEREGKYGVGPALQSNVIRRDGKREESYGPFQLYMGGGLGNKFQKETGLDPRDPSTFEDQVKWTADHVSKNGWGAFHGWKGHPRAGLPAPGGAPGAAMNAAPGRQGANQSGQNITISEININTQATDANGIAQEIPEALRRANFAASANYGLT